MSCVASQTPLMLRSQNQKRNRLFTLSLSCLLHWQQPPRHQRGLFSRSSTSSHSFTDVHPLSPSSCPPSSLLSICESSSSQPPSPLRLFTVINFTVTWQSKACFFRAERSELGVVTERQLIGACHRTNERSLCEIHKHRGRSALATQILTFLIFLCCFQVTKLHFFFFVILCFDNISNESFISGNSNFCPNYKSNWSVMSFTLVSICVSSGLLFINATTTCWHQKTLGVVMVK